MSSNPADLFGTVGDILDEGQPAPAPPAPFVMPTIEGYPVEIPAPGIYFGMNEDLYHSVPSLSYSGIKKLAASPLLYWMTTPWLNPAIPEEEDKDHLTLGRAWHCLVCEGREVFESRFATYLNKADYPNALVTLDDIKAAYPEGIRPKGKNKAEVLTHLREYDATVESWDEIKAAHEAAHEGKSFIGAHARRQLEIAAAMILNDPQLSKAFSGGFPEVSFFWRDPDTGIPCKARVDYLKTRALIDAKTYANPQALSPERAIARAIANNRYALQPVQYLAGVAEVRRLVRQGSAVVSGTSEQQTWAREKWAKHAEPDQFMFVFSQTGIAPITRGLWWPRGGATHTIASEIVRQMKQRFRRFAETFGRDHWLDVADIYDLADEDLPPFATEI